MGVLREMMEADRERLGQKIGDQVRSIAKYVAQERPGIVLAGEPLAQHRNQRGLGPVSDHFVRIQEMLTLRQQAQKPLRFRQLATRHAFGSRLPFGLEIGDRLMPFRFCA